MELNAALIGYKGKLGHCIKKWCEDDKDTTLSVLIDRNDPIDMKNKQVNIAIEVSNAQSVLNNTKALINQSIPTIVGASGIHTNDYPLLDKMAKDKNVPLWIVPNFSISVVLMTEVVKKISRFYSHCHIVESHHLKKIDRPSGTAAHTATTIKNFSDLNPEISSIRLPGVLADQEVIFAQSGETFKLSHHTESHQAFKEGFVLALKNLHQMESGLTIGLENLLTL
tara:strand:+ start:2203 stop:2877 length:675 start_codon:yes stop_codon:yes gene_type:complete